MLELPPDWATLLADELSQPYWRELSAFLDAEYCDHTVYPPRDKLFTALRLTPPAAVRVVILGQDPYHQPGQAMGLAFSVPAGVKPPPSLRNIFKELHADLGVPTPRHGDLSAWARQGVLLLNAVLTVREGQPGSHQGRGWERFTDAVLSAVSAWPGRRVFVLWGAPAQAKRRLIDARHVVIESPHPSPLSANRGFFGSRPFSRINGALREMGQGEVDWRLN